LVHVLVLAAGSESISAMTARYGGRARRFAERVVDEVAPPVGV
jgi:hypothetical protein